MKQLRKDTARCRPYPKYEDTGVEWLGELPAHWDSCVLGRGFGVQAGFAFKSDDFSADGVSIVRMSNLKSGHLDLSTAVRIPESIVVQDFSLREGDLLIGMSGSISNYAWVTAADLPCQLNQRVGRIQERLGFGHPRFAMYLLISAPVISQVNLLAVGTAQQNISAWQIEHLRIALPGIEEQASIAAFLDRETSKIDALIEKKERLIELLQEKRTALITHAVTKGLDQGVAMKGSGIDWLGDIPAHWEVKRLRHLGQAVIGLTFSPGDLVDSREGTLVLRASNVKDGRIVLDDNVYVRMEIPDRLYTKYGDILICSRSGSRSLIGKNATIDSEAAGVSFGAFMTVFRSTYNAYLSCVLNSTLFDYQSGSFLTSTINQLTVGDLKGFRVPMPPPEEGKAIAEFVKMKTARIDRLIENIQLAIDHLKEYRTALISAAVTGKIDVRAEVA